MRSEKISRKQHVVPDLRGEWRVLKAGAARASRIFTNEAEALSYARMIARKEQGAIYIHNRDGSVRERDISNLTDAPASH
jgi:hypothetical protein